MYSVGLINFPIIFFQTKNAFQTTINPLIIKISTKQLLDDLMGAHMSFFKIEK